MNNEERDKAIENLHRRVAALEDAAKPAEEPKAEVPDVRDQDIQAE